MAQGPKQLVSELVSYNFWQLSIICTSVSYEYTKGTDKIYTKHKENPAKLTTKNQPIRILAQLDRIRKIRWLQVTVIAFGFVIVYMKWKDDMPTRYSKTSDTGSSTSISVQNDLEQTSQNSSDSSAIDYSADNPVTRGYMVYDCSHRWSGSCGGWSDRLSGILSTYMLAILTNRKFLINFDNPCPLENYFEPKSYDWRYNKTLLGSKPSRNYHLKDNNGWKIIDVLLTANSTQPIKDFFTAHVSFVRINWDMTREFRKFFHVENYAPWITRLHFADIYRYIFDLFFQPKPFLLDILNSVVKNKHTDKMFCAHVRIGRSSTLPKDNVRTKSEDIHVILDFIETIDKTRHDLFLATDSNELQKQFRSKYSKNFILNVPGRITHIDQTKNGDLCDGFQKQLLDFLLLRTCDKLVICESGFSMMAAYWREENEGLYCWTRRSVVPCSRYTIHDFFPLPLLSPPR
ncbi:uncharacterized protein LOC132565044 [Ylistrum balloti]|uniref:uncharacterized protein LOC132565044 n=1 Tax=Ylistrum balloti TaxID=509963 RepID=UPI002905E7FA|nr:uncharacterized protein LOC132565044 [Ylistrum balloti]